MRSYFIHVGQRVRSLAVTHDSLTHFHIWEVATVLQYY